ncbi:MAG: TrbI/VirB10 family protein [Cardiobacteriaceae bacterium]|nr:TrbI/VirB10 family protein [Cardiobacteriaceae bacterium]
MSVINDPGNSPNSPTSGVRRLNKLPMIIAFTVLALVVLGIIYALHSRSVQRSSNNKGNNGTINKNAAAENILAGIGDGIADSETIVIDNTKPTPELPLPQKTAEDKKEEETEDKEAQRIADLVRQFRERNYYEALVARTPIEESSKKATAEEPTDAGRLDKPLTWNNQGAALERALAAQGIEGIESLLGNRDPNLHSRKESFSQTENPYGYIASVREPQLTEYEIRVGAVIPAVMVSGINSDLPGDIIAQVTHDVYDSKTGRYILIPQGSKLIGRYDSQIAMGQERVMIAWYRLQFPDASIFNLGNMGAVDLAGYAGMNDRVNNHTWRIFKGALLLSVIGAGTQIAIGDSSNENSPINVAKSEFGRQIGEAGNEMVKRNLNIQPTLEIRPGYRFNVMVNKDLILTPYQN